MRPSDERQQVVFAERVERNVANHHHLVVLDVECAEEVVGRFLVDAAAHLGVHARHPGGGLPEAVAIDVLADGLEDLVDGCLDASKVDFEVVAHVSEPSCASWSSTRISVRFR